MASTNNTTVMSTNNTSNQPNLLYGCNGETVQTQSQFESILMGIVMFLIIMVALFGNSLVILTIYKQQKLRNITNMLLCSLAFSDLLSPVLRVTFIAISSLKGKWIFGCSWCTASSQIGIFFCAASIAHLCTVTLERYISIIHPYRHQDWLTKRRIALAITFIWSVSVLLAILPFIFKDKIGLKFNRYLLSCEIHLVRNPYLSIILCAIYFIVPFLIMVFAYYRIFCAASVQTKKMSQYSIGTRETKQKRLVQQELKTVKTVIIVVGVFFILWLPYFVIAVVRSYYPVFPYRVTLFAYCFVYLNTCSNWIVYSVLNRKLRGGFLKLLHLNPKPKALDINRESIASTHGTNKAHSNLAFEAEHCENGIQRGTSVRFTDNIPNSNEETIAEEQTIPNGKTDHEPMANGDSISGGETALSGETRNTTEATYADDRSNNLPLKPQHNKVEATLNDSANVDRCTEFQSSTEPSMCNYASNQFHE